VCELTCVGERTIQLTWLSNSRVTG